MPADKAVATAAPSIPYVGIKSIFKTIARTNKKNNKYVPYLYLSDVKSMEVLTPVAMLKKPPIHAIIATDSPF
jgi:hypothetical protein